MSHTSSKPISKFSIIASKKNGPELPRKDCEAKHLDMFNRRARSGQCFYQPCLGTRKFPARFTLVEDDASFPASTLSEDCKKPHARLDAS